MLFKAKAQYPKDRGAGLMPRLVGVIACLIPFTSTADKPATPLPLTPGAVQTFAIQADQPLIFQFDSEPGRSYLLEVDQGGLDLQISVIPRSGEPRNYNSPLFRDERELVLIEPDAQCSCRIELVSREHTAAVGKPTVSISDITPASDAERDRYEILRLMSLASRASPGNGEKSGPTAVERYEHAAALARSNNESRLLAQSLYSQATLIYWESGNYDLAEQLAAESVEAYTTAGQPLLAANSNQLRGAIVIEQMSMVKKSESTGLAPEAQVLFEKSIALFQDALAVQKKLGAEYDAARTTNLIGIAYFNIGELDKAAAFYREAADYFHQAEEWGEAFIPSANLATLDHNRGNLIRAIDYYQSAIASWPPGKFESSKAGNYDNLAASQKALGRLDDALQSYSEALTIHRLETDLIHEGNSVTGLGTTYLDIGELELALEYLQTALEIRRKTNDGNGMVSVLNAIGNIHRRNGDTDAALEAHREAAQFATAPANRATTRQLIARDLLAAGDPAGALEALEGTEELALSLARRSLLADTRNIAGEAMLQGGNPAEALESFNSAAELYGVLGLDSEQAGATFGAARASRALGQDGKARDLGWLAIQRIERLRSQLISPGLRAFFLATRQQYYAFMVDHLMAMHAEVENNGDTYLREALEVSERSRARALVDLVNEASVDISSPAASASEDEILQKMAEARYRLDRLLEAPDQGSQELAVLALRQELAELEHELNLLQIEIRKGHPAYAQLTHPTILNSHEIQGQLDKDSALLHFSLGEPRSYLWLLTSDSIIGRQLAGREKIEGVARQLHSLLARPANSEKTRADLEASTSELSAQLLRLAGPLPGKRLIIVADGVLQYVPFSILYEPGSENPLVNSHEIVHLPSTSVLAAQRLVKKGVQAGNRKIAIFADPVFEPGDRRLAGRPPNGDDAVNDTDPNGLERLPATAREAEAIAGLVEPEQKLLATGFEASRSNVLEASLGDFQVVHFATHGLIDSRYPALSSLAFSRFNELGVPQENLLRLHDLYNLELNAQLVTLSACSTALGREISGEGLNGLTQGLMHSGSKSVLASLWQVPDRATAELMKLFYRNLLEKEQKPAAALRNAQLDLSSRKRWQGPYFWSAFVLQGDWR